MINRPKVGRVNLENDIKFQIHGPFELGSYFFKEDNVLITYMKFFFYKNCMASLVAMATVHEKIQMTFPMELLSHF